jgi:hypothetical protein
MGTTRFIDRIVHTCPVHLTGSIWAGSQIAVMQFVKLENTSLKLMDAIFVHENATQVDGSANSITKYVLGQSAIKFRYLLNNERG